MTRPGKSMFETSFQTTIVDSGQCTVDSFGVGIADLFQLLPEAIPQLSIVNCAEGASNIDLSRSPVSGSNIESTKRFFGNV
jgi:hypothetical protein